MSLPQRTRPLSARPGAPSLRFNYGPISSADAPSTHHVTAEDLCQSAFSDIRRNLQMPGPQFQPSTPLHFQQTNLSAQRVRHTTHQQQPSAFRPRTPQQPNHSVASAGHNSSQQSLGLLAETQRLLEKTTHEKHLLQRENVELRQQIDDLEGALEGAQLQADDLQVQLQQQALQPQHPAVPRLNLSRTALPDRPAEDGYDSYEQQLPQAVVEVLPEDIAVAAERGLQVVATLYDLSEVPRAAQQPNDDDPQNDAPSVADLIAFLTDRLADLSSTRERCDQLDAERQQTAEEFQRLAAQWEAEQEALRAELARAKQQQQQQQQQPTPPSTGGPSPINSPSRNRRGGEEDDDLARQQQQQQEEDDAAAARLLALQKEVAAEQTTQQSLFDELRMEELLSAVRSVGEARSPSSIDGNGALPQRRHTDNIDALFSAIDEDIDKVDTLQSQLESKWDKRQKAITQKTHSVQKRMRKLQQRELLAIERESALRLREEAIEQATQDIAEQQQEIADQVAHLEERTKEESAKLAQYQTELAKQSEDVFEAAQTLEAHRLELQETRRKAEAEIASMKDAARARCRLLEEECEKRCRQLEEDAASTEPNRSAINDRSPESDEDAYSSSFENNAAEEPSLAFPLSRWLPTGVSIIKGVGELPTPAALESVSLPPTTTNAAFCAAVKSWTFDALASAETAKKTSEDAEGEEQGADCNNTSSASPRLDASDNGVLYQTSRIVAEELGLFEKAVVDEATFNRFVTQIQCGYRDDIPYHTAVHAADVVHSMFHFLKSSTTTNLLANLTPVELLAAVVAPLIHDYQHPGRNNAFLVKIRDPVAILHNDQHVLENHHVQAAFELMQHPSLDITSKLSDTEASEFRQLVIRLVLGTDLAEHGTLMRRFCTLATTTNSSAAAPLLNTPLPATSIYRKQWDPATSREDRHTLLELFLHAADFGAAAKGTEIFTKWMPLVFMEMQEQAEEERALLASKEQAAAQPDEASEAPRPPPPPATTGSAVAMRQVGFTDSFMLPLFRELAVVDPDGFAEPLRMLIAGRDDVAAMCNLPPLPEMPQPKCCHFERNKAQQQRDQDTEVAIPTGGGGNDRLDQGRSEEEEADIEQASAEMGRLLKLVSQYQEQCETLVTENQELMRELLKANDAL